MAQLKSAFAKLTPGRAVARPGAKIPAAAPKSTLAGALPAQVGGAAPAPVAPAFSPQFGADVNSAQLNLNTTLQQNQAQRGQLGSTYGFTVENDGSILQDNSNPFSRALALQTAYNNSVRSTTGNLASRGQLYSGYLQSTQEEGAKHHLEGRDALIREFMAQRTGLSNSDVSASNAYSTAISNAAAAQAQYALDNRPDPASVPRPVPVAVKAAVKRKKK